jgi:hypothetical protein
LPDPELERRPVPEQTAILVEHASPPAEIAAAVERHWRVLARAILDGYPVGHLQHHFPLVTKLVDEARHHNTDEASARIAAGHAVAFELGWRLFESFIRSAAQLEDLTADELRRSANQLRDSILSTPSTAEIAAPLTRRPSETRNVGPSRAFGKVRSCYTLSAPSRPLTPGTHDGQDRCRRGRLEPRPDGNSPVKPSGPTDTSVALATMMRLWRIAPG